MVKTGKTMLDDAIRASFLILGGLTLGVAVIWYLGLLYQEIRGTGQIVIDPLTVIDNGGKANDELGKALAQMLQARLQSLVRELRDAQAGFTTNVRAPALAQGAPAAPVGDVRLWTQAVTLQTGLLQPIDMKLSVGGVDVGGILPGLQRWLSSRRTLHFTLYSQDTEVQIFGSLAALRLSDAGLRLHVKGPDGKAPSLDVIVDGLAHEIVHRYLAQDTTNRLEVLDPSEFTSLADVLVSVAQANRKSIRGRPAQKEFAALVPSITALADKVPDWPELGYLAARIADSGRDSHTALTYYRRVLPKFEDGGQPELVSWINTRISDLASISAEVKTPDVTVEPLPRALDYSSEINSVRDQGPEGSVVGMALATALEFQIAKVEKKQQKISARYIYYAARKKAAGFDLNIDSGAEIKDGIAVLSNEGAVTEDVWPYRPGKFAEKPPTAVEKAERFRITDARPLATVDDLKRALKQNGPVVAGITVFQGMMTVEVSKTGVIPLPTKKEQIVGGHAIVIVGYDDEKRRLRFANSWGKQWGEQGFGYLPYEYVKKYLTDAWTFRLLTT
jgi:hypothetical protein